ncbi:MAG: OmpH family outer membrane protein [Gemmatimonadota bacterium]
MRNTFLRLITAAGMLAIAAPLTAQAAGNRIGYIDTRAVIQQAPGAEAARATMESEMQTWQAELQTMEDSLQALMTDYQQKTSVMTPEAKQRAEQQITQAQGSFRQRAEALQQQAAQRQQELMQPIMAQLETVISEVRQAEGYAMIFDIAAEGIVSADPSLDVTAKVLERLKAAPAAETAARNP